MVQQCAILAVLLEVSGYPKPGNVHRTRDTPKTRYEHFLAGAVAIGPSIRDAALSGHRVSSGGINVKEAGVGKHILRAVIDTSNWQSGGNVNLGTILLFIPLAVAAGMAHPCGKIVLSKLRENVRKVMESTTADDTLAVYEAISIANPGGLGRVEKYDVTNEVSKSLIRRENVALQDVFRVSAGWDNISKEWITGMEITFEVGYPTFLRIYNEFRDVNTATVHTFLEILSKNPDTLIQRKTSREKALEISKAAAEILKQGGLTSEKGRTMCWKLDEKLHRSKGKLNPGTTADLTASSIFVALLEGFRF
ncbi:MAG: triphosphoribosyl-dephospho-CoA synthase [Candidatus Freyarchaeota archaeon]|nr:triphosphoribosyl-dephospho-CoA synthase [Candidatus Jordarchaeia archaeon]MBS7268010.1 triphosphoribosyl-dephospho-CoA synthase [Candidatus Jordarchaeia archaeon]MBS7278371.1 triphosphoribosyl-dephospho-CoA synthase [Candidatus Jordarchaeia archaeon]